MAPFLGLHEQSELIVTFAAGVVLVFGTRQVRPLASFEASADDLGDSFGVRRS